MLTREPFILNFLVEKRKFQRHSRRIVLFSTRKYSMNGSGVSKKFHIWTFDINEPKVQIWKFLVTLEPFILDFLVENENFPAIQNDFFSTQKSTMNSSRVSQKNYIWNFNINKPKVQIWKFFANSPTIHIRFFVEKRKFPRHSRRNFVFQQENLMWMVRELNCFSYLDLWNKWTKCPNMRIFC